MDDDVSSNAAAATPLDDEDQWLEPEDCTDEELGYGVEPTAAERAEAQARLRRWRERWRRLPDDDPPAALEVTPATVGTVVRAVRRHIRLNQRELAAATGMTRSMAGRLESADENDVRLSTLLRVLAVGGLRLVVVDDEETVLARPDDHEPFRDRSARQLPAHLDLYAPHLTHRSRYRARDFVGPARVTAGRERPRRRPATPG